MPVPETPIRALPTGRRRKTPTRRALAEARLSNLTSDHRDALTLLAAVVRNLPNGVARLTEEDFDTLDARSRIETTMEDGLLTLRVVEPMGKRAAALARAKRARNAKAKPAPADEEGDGERAFRNPHGHEPTAPAENLEPAAQEEA